MDIIPASWKNENEHAYFGCFIHVFLEEQGFKMTAVKLTRFKDSNNFCIRIVYKEFKCYFFFDVESQCKVRTPKEA